MKPNKGMIVLFLAPAVLSYVLIFLYPTLRTIYLGFFEVNDFLGAELTYRGLGNYLQLFRTPLFLQSLRNIFVVWTVGGAAIFGLIFLFTTLLTSGIRGAKFFRAVIYLPNLIPVVAMTTMWSQYIYNPRYGLLKTFFTAIGLEGLAAIQWTSQDLLFWSMLIAYVWGGVGWYLLIILAGYERIPPDYYDAAKVDGANQVQTFFAVTLPLLRDVLRVTLVMWSIGVINLFAFPRTFTPVGSQPRQTMTPVIYLYSLAFGQSGQAGLVQVGKAAAAGVILLVLVVLTYMLFSRLIRQSEFEY